jgi:hypothetical protein
MFRGSGNMGWQQAVSSMRSKACFCFRQVMVRNAQSRPEVRLLASKAVTTPWAQDMCLAQQQQQQSEGFAEVREFRVCCSYKSSNFEAMIQNGDSTSYSKSL